MDLAETGGSPFVGYTHSAAQSGPFLLNDIIELVSDAKNICYLRIFNARQFSCSLLCPSNSRKIDAAPRDRLMGQASGILRGKPEDGLGAAKSNTAINNKKRILSLTGDL